MIICLKHKVDFIHGECPKCKALKEGISYNYKSSDPVHQSLFIRDKLNELKKYSDELKKLNIRLSKLVKVNKENK